MYQCTLNVEHETMTFYGIVDIFLLRSGWFPLARMNPLHMIKSTEQWELKLTSGAKLWNLKAFPSGTLEFHRKIGIPRYSNFFWGIPKGIPFSRMGSTKSEYLIHQSRLLIPVHTHNIITVCKSLNYATSFCSVISFTQYYQDGFAKS